MVTGYDTQGKCKPVEVFDMGDKKYVAKLYETKAQGSDGKEHTVSVWASPCSQKLDGCTTQDMVKLLTPNEGTPRALSERGMPFGAVTIPFIDMDRKEELPALKGLKHEDGSVITQATLNSKLQVNDKGFSAKEAVAAVSSRGMPQAFELNGKMLNLWVTSDRCSEPLYAAQIDKQYFKNPGDIKELETK